MMFGRMMEAIRPQQSTAKALATIETLMGLYVGGGRTIPIKGENAALGQQMWGRAAPSLNLTQVGLSQAFQINETVYRAIDLRSAKLGNIPLQVLEKKSGKPIPDHPLLKAMDFSRRYYRKPLIRSIEYGWCLFGETYIEKVRDQYSKVVALLWLNPQSMTPMIQNGGIQYYEYTPSGHFTQTQRYSPKAIIYDYTYNPDDDWRGLSPLSVAMGHVNVNKYIEDYTAAYFQNEARPGGILTARGSTVLTKQDQERLLKQWSDQLKGSQNQRKTIFLPSSLEFQTVQDSPADQHSQVETNADEKICLALGVPYTLLFPPDAARMDNDEDKKSFFEDTIFPRCEQLEVLINEEVLPYFGDIETERFRFDVDKVRVTYGNQIQKATAINSQLLAGGMSLNEHRLEFGRNPVAGGDLYIMPKNATLVNESELGQVVQQQRDAEEKAAEEKARQFDAQLQSNEKLKGPASGANAPQETPDERRNAINSQGRNNQPAKAELAAWQRKTLRKGITQGMKFRAEFISDTIATQVRAKLEGLDEDATPEDVRLIFAEAKSLVDRLDNDDAVAEMLNILAELGVSVV